MKIRPWHIWSAIAATAALDICELLVTVPKLMALSGGMPTFDMRIGGYTREAAGMLLHALDTAGHTYYAAWHIPVDCVLAIVEALAISLILLRFTRPYGRFAIPLAGGWRSMLLVLPLATMVLDLGENAIVLMMLADFPSQTELMVRVASLTTQLKWICAALSLAAASLLPLAALIRELRPRRIRPT